MEQNIAILIADLSGYTALTETHGAITAADLIDKYLEIENDSLVGDSVLHQRVGDEVMIVSTAPDHLISTAIMLIQNCSKEHNFLQVHGVVNALLNRSAFTFSSKGRHRFKNISEENEVFELIIEHPNFLYIDPVCRMLIHKKETSIPHPHEQNIFFCSPDCLDIYIRNKVILNS